MAREIDTTKPLSEKDVSFLRSRYPDAYVDRLVLLAGSSEGSPEPDEATSADESAQEGVGGALGQPEVSEALSAPESDASDPSGVGDDGDDDDDDLIGVSVEPSYDPLAFTTREVRDYLKGVSPEEQERVKAVELARTDREPRTTITNFDPNR